MQKKVILFLSQHISGFILLSWQCCL